jgi:hypothetical protein
MRRFSKNEEANETRSFDMTEIIIPYNKAKNEDTTKTDLPVTLDNTHTVLKDFSHCELHNIFGTFREPLGAIDNIIVKDYAEQERKIRNNKELIRLYQALPDYGRLFWHQSMINVRSVLHNILHDTANYLRSSFEELKLRLEFNIDTNTIIYQDDNVIVQFAVNLIVSDLLFVPDDVKILNIVEYSYGFIDHYYATHLVRNSQGINLWNYIIYDNKDKANLFIIWLVDCLIREAIVLNVVNLYSDYLLSNCYSSLIRALRDFDAQLIDIQDSVDRGIECTRRVHPMTAYLIIRTVALLKPSISYISNEVKLHIELPRELIKSSVWTLRNAIFMKAMESAYSLEIKDSILFEIDRNAFNQNSIVRLAPNDDDSSDIENALYAVLTPRGYKYTIRRYIWPLLVVLVVTALFVLICGMKKMPFMTFDGVDPTSLTSLVIVMEGLFLAFIVATFHEDWSWYDMIRGQLFVSEFEKLPRRVIKRYNKGKLVRHFIRRQDDYKDIVSRYNACYLSVETTGRFTLPFGATISDLKKCGFETFLSVGQSGKKHVIWDPEIKNFRKISIIKSGMAHMERKIEKIDLIMPLYYESEIVVAVDIEQTMRVLF